MFEEKLDKLAGKKEPLPKIVKMQEPANNEALESAANRAISEYSKATGLRHSYGSGLPPDHPALQ